MNLSWQSSAVGSILMLGLLSSCGVPSSTISSDDPQAKINAINGANLALSSQNCSGALSQVLPFYDSVYSDNQIRLITSSAYGCHAGINIFKVLDDLIHFSGDFGGSGFWEFLVSEFPSSSSTIDNKVSQAAKNAIDAAMSAIKPGTILVPEYIVNASSNNPASLLNTDRIDDANSYLTFLGMSLMGSLMSFNGLPLANHHKSVPLPWTDATLMAGDGCSLASGLLIFIDGLNSIIGVAGSSSVARHYETIETFLTAGADLACQAGCAICGGSVSCTVCPVSLRDRTSCTGVNTDVNSCAAAGLVNFINSTWAGPP